MEQKPHTLQNRLEQGDIGAVIIDFLPTRIETVYFINKDRLSDYLDGVMCFYGKGRHNIENDLKYYLLKDGMLVIERHNEIDTCKSEFITIATIKVQKEINSEETIKLRRDIYNDGYYIIREPGRKTKRGIHFETIEKVKEYLEKDFLNYAILNGEIPNSMEKMILIDLETQDFHVNSGIFEVACMAIENYKIVDTLYIAKDVEGYKGSKKYGKGFHNICEDLESIKVFEKFIQRYNYPLVAHNCPFDRKFLVHYSWINEEYPMYCSMRAIRNQLPNLESYSMSNLIKYFNVEENESHTALGDINMLFNILVQVKPEKWHSLGSKSNRNTSQIKPKPRNLESID